MKLFKERTEENKGQGNLPQPDVFGKSLYLIYVGQNDFVGYVSGAGPGGVKQIGPQAVSQTQSAIKLLPCILGPFPHQSSDIDQAGCMTTYNSMLKQAVQQSRGELYDANVIYVDTHSMLLELFQRPTSHEAASRILANNAILSGKSFDPEFSFNQYCDIQPIG
ncbi:hypothetical protein ACJIZ3_016058 [Penstemon smallii]|uniref:GDSL esterase/lipase n=1 Tax=Penstemon smallii TaxID=265156 RepID=A0ABD3RPA0_9LAMI